MYSRFCLKVIGKSDPPSMTVYSLFGLTVRKFWYIVTKIPYHFCRKAKAIYIADFGIGVFYGKKENFHFFLYIIWNFWWVLWGIYSLCSQLVYKKTSCFKNMHEIKHDRIERITHRTVWVVLNCLKHQDKIFVFIYVYTVTRGARQNYDKKRIHRDVFLHQT